MGIVKKLWAPLTAALAVALLALPAQSQAYEVSEPVVGGLTAAVHRDWDYSTRLDTASGFAQYYSNRAKSTVPGVVVVNGWAYPDGVVASGLAGNLGYALVYVGPYGFGDEAMADIDAMAPASVVVVGGPAVVPDSALSELSSRGYVTGVDRVWGADRYATAAAVHSYGQSHGSGWSGTALLVSGDGFADGASAASLAAYGRMPVALASGGSVPGSEAGVFSDASSVIVVGGEAVVPQSAVASLPGGLGSSAERIAGPDRYATSRAVADYEASLQEPDPSGGSSTQNPFSYENVVLVKGTSHADALAIGTNSAVFPCYGIHQAPWDSASRHKGRAIVIMAGEGHCAEVSNQIESVEDTGSGAQLGAMINSVTFTANAFSEKDMTSFCNAICRYGWKYVE